MRVGGLALAAFVLATPALSADQGQVPTAPVPLTMFEINALTIAVQSASGRCAPGAEIYCQIGLVSAPLLAKLADAQKTLSVQPIVQEKK